MLFVFNEFYLLQKREFIMFIRGTEGWIKHETHVIVVISKATNHEELSSSDLPEAAWEKMRQLFLNHSRGTLMLSAPA